MCESDDEIGLSDEDYEQEDAMDASATDQAGAAVSAEAGQSPGTPCAKVGAIAGADDAESESGTDAIPDWILKKSSRRAVQKKHEREKRG